MQHLPVPAPPQLNFLQRAAAKLFRMQWSGYGGQNSPGWMLRLLLPQSQFDYEREIELSGGAWRNSAVYGCLRWIQNNITEPRPMVVRVKGKGKNAEIVGHPLAQLLRRPNPFMSGDRLLQAAALSWNCYGNVYFIIARGAGGAGQPLQLWWWPPHSISPQYPMDGSAYITHYLYRANGREFRLETNEVVHLRNGQDPNNDRLGLAPLASAFREIYGDNMSSTLQSALCRNMGAPGLVFSPVDPSVEISSEARASLKDQVRMATTGDNAGTPLAPPYAVKVDKLGFSPKEMDLGVLHRFPEERISSVLGVPAILAGLGTGLENATYSNAKTLARLGYYGAVIPTLKTWAEEFNAQLLPYMGNPDTEMLTWDFLDVEALQDDRNEAATRLSGLYTSGLIMRNEGRAELGYPPVEEQADIEGDADA